MMVSDVRTLPSGLPRWRGTGTAGIIGAVFVTIILTWNFWWTTETLADVDDDTPFIVSDDDIIFDVDSGTFVSLKPRIELDQQAEVKVVLDDPEIVDTIGSFTIKPKSNRVIFIPLHSKKVAGHCVLSFSSKSKELEGLYKVRVRVKVVHHIFFGYFAIALGWGFFFAWGLTYYPQLYQNWRRRSVVGLSFDYIALNFTGHLCFCIFNMAMFYNSGTQLAYHKLHPKGELPVKSNDCVFSIHAVIMNVVIILQCLTFDIGEQKLSVPMMTLVCGLWMSGVGALFTAICERISWLQFLYFLSYIKVATTPIKYCPQLYLNFLRKSTEGWAIQSVLLDMTGGIFCLAQMVVDAFNNDDWDGTLGNPAKLGLSFISIICNLAFVFQHYFLYRGGVSRKRHDTDSFIIDKKDDMRVDKTFIQPFSRSKLTNRLQDI